MPIVINTELLEARPREFQDDVEKRLKKKLIALLRDDGKGHHHAKYAERLEKFDIQIVPLKADPSFTAAIAFDHGIIYIGEGFLTDPATFYQLNVLIRHELAHNLLMHQVRMAYKIGEEAHLHMSLSSSLHELQNIIADDEISNRKYSEEDKIVVRNMTLNGRVIGGLVTEDHRKSWINMSIEEMYDQICNEIDEIQKQLHSGKTLDDIAMINSDDPITGSILGTYIYSDITSDSIIQDTLKAFIEKGCTVGKKRLRDEFVVIITQIFEELSEKSLDDAEIKNLLIKVATASPIEKIDLFGDKKVVLYSPEEKYIAVETLKKFKSEYAEWYDKVLTSLDELTNEEIQELFDMLK